MSLIGRFRLAHDRSLTVANLVDKLVELRGDGVVSVGDDGEYSLGDLHRDILRLDAFLRDVVELKPGQPVAIYRTNDRYCFHWFLAIIRAGGVAVPLNPQLTLAEVRRILADSGTTILVTDKPVFERTIGSRDALPAEVWIDSGEQAIPTEGFLRPAKSAPAYPPVVLDSSATIAVFHTSGTSGFPKGAALSSRSLLGARNTTWLTGLILGHRDLALIALPWSHIMAVSIALYGLMAGIRGCLLEKFDVEAALDCVERHRVTAFVGVPAILARLVNSNPEPARLRTIRVWLSASDHLPEAVRMRLRDYGALLRLPFGRRIPPVLLNGYGMVELGGLAMMGVDLSFAPGSGDLCIPVPPFRVRIVDESGRVLPAGQTGECQISRRGIRPHYWKGTAQADSLLTDDG